MSEPRIVMTSGVFDLLHQGHLNILAASKALGDRLVVGVVSDAGTKAYKFRSPVQDEQTRLAVVRALRMVDEAVLQETTDPTPLLERIRPAVFSHGDDWDRLREGHDTLQRLGIDFVTLPYTPGVSTSALIEAARAGGEAR